MNLKTGTHFLENEAFVLWPPFSVVLIFPHSAYQVSIIEKQKAEVRKTRSFQKVEDI